MSPKAAQATTRRNSCLEIQSERSDYTVGLAGEHAMHGGVPGMVVGCSAALHEVRKMAAQSRSTGGSGKHETPFACSLEKIADQRAARSQKADMHKNGVRQDRDEEIAEGYVSDFGPRPFRSPKLLIGWHRAHMLPVFRFGD